MEYVTFVNSLGCGAHMGDCARCHKPLDGAVITALDQSWHADCFRCELCNGDFPDGQFVAHDGRPFHSDCYDKSFGETCSRCGQVCKVWPHDPL